MGNKHTHLQARIERARQQYEGVSANLSDIKAEVDKYLLWLTKQEQMMSEKVIAGKHLQSAEIRLENSKVNKRRDLTSYFILLPFLSSPKLGTRIQKVFLINEIYFEKHYEDVKRNYD